VYTLRDKFLQQVPATSPLVCASSFKITPSDEKKPKKKKKRKKGKKRKT